MTEATKLALFEFDGAFLGTSILDDDFTAERGVPALLNGFKNHSENEDIEVAIFTTRPEEDAAHIQAWLEEKTGISIDLLSIYTFGHRDLRSWGVKQLYYKWVVGLACRLLENKPKLDDMTEVLTVVVGDGHQKVLDLIKDKLSEERGDYCQYHKRVVYREVPMTSSLHFRGTNPFQVHDYYCQGEYPDTDGNGNIGYYDRFQGIAPDTYERMLVWSGYQKRPPNKGMRENCFQSIACKGFDVMQLLLDEGIFNKDNMFEDSITVLRKILQEYRDLSEQALEDQESLNSNAADERHHRID